MFLPIGTAAAGTRPAAGETDLERGGARKPRWRRLAARKHLGQGHFGPVTTKQHGQLRFDDEAEDFETARNVAEQSLSETIGSLERLSDRDPEQVELCQKLKQAREDLREGVEATKRLVRER